MNVKKNGLIHRCVESQRVYHVNGWQRLTTRCDLRLKHHPTTHNREAQEPVNCIVCLGT